MRTLLSVLAIAVTVCAQAFSYSTDFETMSLGALHGQDGWVDQFGSYEVVGSGALSGSKAVLFNHTTGTANPWAWWSLPSGTADAVASVWVNVSPNSNVNMAFGLDAIFDALSPDFATILVNKNGDVFGTQGTSTNSNLGNLGNVGALSGYVKVELLVNTATHETWGRVNGSLFDLPDVMSSSSIQDIDLTSLNLNNGTGNAGFAHFDDFSVQSVPEPITLGLAAFAIVVARRRRTA